MASQRVSEYLREFASNLEANSQESSSNCELLVQNLRDIITQDLNFEELDLCCKILFDISPTSPDLLSLFSKTLHSNYGTNYAKPR